MDDAAATHDEHAAHFGPDGPVAAAQAWLEAVIVTSDWTEAWGRMTATLRMARAQAWLWNNKDFFERAAESLEEQADMLHKVPSEHPYWDEFAQLELEAFREAFPGDRYDKVGVASKPRPLSPGLELVLFIPMEEVQAIEGTLVDPDGAVWLTETPEEGVQVAPFAQMLMEHGNAGWLVAGTNGENFPAPGWPPTL